MHGNGCTVSKHLLAGTNKSLRSVYINEYMYRRDGIESKIAQGKVFFLLLVLMVAEPVFVNV